MKKTLYRWFFLFLPLFVIRWHVRRVIRKSEHPDAAFAKTIQGELTIYFKEKGEPPPKIEGHVYRSMVDTERAFYNYFVETMIVQQFYHRDQKDIDDYLENWAQRAYFIFVGQSKSKDVNTQQNHFNITCALQKVKEAILEQIAKLKSMHRKGLENDEKRKREEDGDS